MTGGLTVGTASSIGNIELTGDFSSIAFNDAETLDYASVTVSGSAVYIYGNGSMLTFGAATTVALSGNNDWLSGTFTNLGGIDVTAGLTTAAGSTFDNQGSLSVTGGGDLFVAQTTFSNEGQISVVGGYMDVESTTFTSTDALLLGGGGTLEIAPATAAAVTYEGPSTLILDYPTTYTGTLSGLAPGDMLQLDGETVTSASIVGTTLTVVLQSGGPLTYATGAGLSGTQFSISTGSDGYKDLLTVVCFLAGTRILTEHGEMRVEDLREGDRVVTRGADGAALEPVHWIGRRRIDTGAHPRPCECRPIRIRRDAIAPGRPHRDLLVSPDHAVFLDGMLIPAKLLVNGMTIVQDDIIRHVEYFHVELDRHSILVSEGLETESYLDTGNRAVFENAGLAMTLHPAFSVETRIRNWNDHAYAPLAVARSAVEPIWRRLATRAAELGYMPPPPPKTTAEPDLQLVVCGRVLRPIDLADGRYIFGLPRGADSAVLHSRAAAPADFEPFDQDRRRLGVALRRLRLHLRGAERLCEIMVDAPVLSQGWWAAESSADVLWRWTDGAALIPLPAGATMLEVELHGVHRYPVGALVPLQAAAA